ncbi:hypothetical protein ACET3Z_028271 [Daucus carota]
MPRADLWPVIETYHYRVWSINKDSSSSVSRARHKFQEASQTTRDSWQPNFISLLVELFEAHHNPVAMVNIIGLLVR